MDFDLKIVEGNLVCDVQNFKIYYFENGVVTYPLAIATALGIEWFFATSYRFSFGVYFVYIKNENDWICSIKDVR